MSVQPVISGDNYNLIMRFSVLLARGYQWPVCLYLVQVWVWVSPVGAAAPPKSWMRLQYACADCQPRAAQAGPCHHYLCPQLNCEARGNRRLYIGDERNYPKHKHWKKISDSDTNHLSIRIISRYHQWHVIETISLNILNVKMCCHLTWLTSVR